MQPARIDDVRQVHSYVDELLAAAREDAPTAVADIGDPGELMTVVKKPGLHYGHCLV